MKCMCAQTRPRFILSSEGVLGGMEFEPMLTPREKSPLPENVPRGGSNLRHCGQRAQVLPAELFQPQTVLVLLFVFIVFVCFFVFVCLLFVVFQNHPSGYFPSIIHMGEIKWVQDYSDQMFHMYNLLHNGLQKTFQDNAQNISNCNTL